MNSNLIDIKYKINDDAVEVKGYLINFSDKDSIIYENFVKKGEAFFKMHFRIYNKTKYLEKFVDYKGDLTKKLDRIPGLKKIDEYIYFIHIFGFYNDLTKYTALEYKNIFRGIARKILCEVFTKLMGRFSITGEGEALNSENTLVSLEANGSIHSGLEEKERKEFILSLNEEETLKIMETKYLEKSFLEISKKRITSSAKDLLEEGNDSWRTIDDLIVMLETNDLVEYYNRSFGLNELTCDDVAQVFMVTELETLVRRCVSNSKETKYVLNLNM
jgi:hypothetical protein